MTEKKLREPPRGFFLNAERSGFGMRISVGCVVSVAELSHESILLVTHGARIGISGPKLSLSVFEGRGVEIHGMVEETKFSYGKT